MKQDKVYIYHYASQRFDSLKTRKLQGIKESNPPLTNTGEIRPGTYEEHISFFIDPVPLRLMGLVYGKDHPVWHSGSVLYEHRVNLAAVSGFKYHFVETPEKIKLLFDDSIDTEEYYSRLNKVNQTQAYVGEDLTKFMQPYSRLKGKTERYILRASTYPKWESNRLKYAACVPHVMLYPKSGVVVPEVVNKVKVA